MDKTLSMMLQNLEGFANKKQYDNIEASILNIELEEVPEGRWINILKTEGFIAAGKDVNDAVWNKFVQFNGYSICPK